MKLHLLLFSFCFVAFVIFSCFDVGLYVLALYCLFVDIIKTHIKHFYGSLYLCNWSVLDYTKGKNEWNECVLRCMNIILNMTTKNREKCCLLSCRLLNGIVFDWDAFEWCNNQFSSIITIRAKNNTWKNSKLQQIHCSFMTSVIHILHTLIHTEEVDGKRYNNHFPFDFRFYAVLLASDIEILFKGIKRSRDKMEVDRNRQN